MPELGHKSDFLLYFIPICVIRPEENIESDCQSLPHQLQRAILYIGAILLLNRGQSDIQESNSGCKADQRYEEDRVQADQVREGDRVEELDLYQWVLGVNVEVDVHHDVEDDDQTEYDDI